MGANLTACPKDLQLPEGVCGEWGLEVWGPGLMCADSGRTDHCRGAARIEQEVCSAGGEWAEADPRRRLTHAQVTQADSVEEQENSEDTLARLGSRIGERVGL
jgi:hypothetical protein